jgi:hypothetical protein
MNDWVDHDRMNHWLDHERMNHLVDHDRRGERFKLVTWSYLSWAESSSSHQVACLVIFCDILKDHSMYLRRLEMSLTNFSYHTT